MKALRPIIYLLLILLLTPCASASLAVEYVVVVHKDNRVNALSAKELKRMFLGKLKRWPDGSSVQLALNPNDAAHADFTREQLHKSPKQFTTLWRKNLYSGRSMMPYAAADAKDLSGYLERHRNAVSYLSKDELTGSMKVVRITK